MSTLYYIRGSKTNPEGVKQILLDRGGNLLIKYSFDEEYCLYYINSNNTISYASVYSQAGDIIQCYGTELKPKESFEPFDRILGRCGEGKWGIDIFMAITYDKYMECIGATYTECHKYEPWMKKYIGTNIPYEKFKKE